MRPHGPPDRLDDEHLYRALAARDARFDGVFFVGVTSTGIYCRPVCRARTPGAARCRFFASAAAAERRGFRPCLRCRPELAPAVADAVVADAAGRDAGGDGVASVDAVRRLARAAGARIAAGALDGDGGVDALAAAFGVTARHLRRAVERELGASPVALAQTRRLLVAKQLLAETRLPVARVAAASGFGSVRRFHSVFQTRYRLTPSAVRGAARGRGPADAPDGPGPDGTGETVRLLLAYRPPYHWPAVRDYLAARATPGVEAVCAAAMAPNSRPGAAADGTSRYWRAVRLGAHRGVVAVGPGARPGTLSVDLSPGLLPAVVPLLAALRRLLDLDAEPASVDAHLGADRLLAAHVARRPGLRVPGAVDGFELALRAVLGQQVSVRGATTLAGRLVRLVGEPLDAEARAAGAPAGLTHHPVDAARLADAGAALVARVGLPRARAEAVVALARAAADGQLPELTGGTLGGASGAAAGPAAFVRRFTALPGVGPWTASYVAMRALRWPDAFPDGDLALRRAAGGLTPARLRRASERWRPWRAYAAMHLWAGLGDGAGDRPHPNALLP
jgi:AraC family transcriptional regulator of adaptative response / DNA-3-methyladenine glycosylase II